MPVDDPAESIDQDYVFVPGSPMDIPSSGHAFKPNRLPSKYGSAPAYPGNVGSMSSTRLPIIGGGTARADHARSIESRLSAPEILHGSVNTVVNSDLPSTDYMMRISSLQRFAAAITEIVSEKVKV